MMPILMVSAACTLKLIPMATTEADKAKAFNKVRRCIIFTPEKQRCAKSSVTAWTQKKQSGLERAKRMPERKISEIRGLERVLKAGTDQNGTALHFINATLWISNYQTSLAI